MKKLFFLGLILFVISCKDDSDEPMQVYAKFSVCDFCDNILITNGEELPLVFDDTLTLIITGGVPVDNSSMGNYSIVSGEGVNIELSQEDENSYIITANEIGMSQIIVTDGSGSVSAINIGIVNEFENYYVSETYSDVDVADETIKKNIEAELSDRSLFNNSKFILEYFKYNTPREGLLEVVSNKEQGDKEYFTGSFKEKTVSGQVHIVMLYNGQTFDFEYKDDLSQSSRCAFLTEDLTRKYQEEYPDAVINGVYAITYVYISTSDAYIDLW